MNHEGYEYFRRYNYPMQTRSILVDFMMGPLLVLLTLVGGFIAWRVSIRSPLLWPSIGGILAAFILARFVGEIQARNQVAEVGFSYDSFYMLSMYDVAKGAPAKLYPLQYAAAYKQGDSIYVNYIGQNMRLKREDWPEWHMLWYKFNEPWADIPH